MSTSLTNADTAIAQGVVASMGATSDDSLDISPNIDHIITEDGAPMDSLFSEKQLRLLTEPLYTAWQSGQPFVAMANVGLFYAPKQPPFVPDTLLSLGVSFPDDLHPKANRSYFVWEYGKPPNVAIEIVSNKEGGEDTIKLEGYAKIGIGYYAIYDPDQHLSDSRLRVYQINGIGYVPLVADATGSFQLPGIGLGLTCWRGDFENCTDNWLRWLDSAGALIPTGAELAEAERQRAETERQRASRLAEQLRKLGIQPEL